MSGSDPSGGCLAGDLPGGPYRVRRARLEDVARLVGLLRDDVLGAGREDASEAAYLDAFAAIDADPRHHLTCVCSPDGTVVATAQLTLLPGLSRGAATRLQVEAVRVAASHRGRGLGGALLDWAHGYGRRHGATLAQLTTDAARTEAHRFYEGLGYRASHVGFKRELEG